MQKDKIVSYMAGLDKQMQQQNAIFSDVLSNYTAPNGTVEVENHLDVYLVEAQVCTVGGYGFYLFIEHSNKPSYFATRFMDILMENVMNELERLGVETYVDTKIYEGEGYKFLVTSTNFKMGH